MTHYKPAFILPGEPQPCTNAQVFETMEEAEASAKARFAVWTMPTDWTVLETDEPVNYRFFGGHDQRITQGDQK